MSLNWIYDWIFAALPSYGENNIFRSKQSVEIPSDPFFTYGVTFLDAGSSFEFKTADSDLYEDPDYEGDPPTPIGTFTRDFQRNCTLQIQIDCYSPTGMLDLAVLIACATSDDYASIFEGAKVSYQGAGTIKDLTGLGDVKYLDRWSVTVEFLAALTREEIKNAILDYSLGVNTDVIDTTITL